VNTMTYRGYAARIAYSEEDGCFVGHIAGIRDVVGFHGESVAELRAAFEDAVDDYLETCARLGRTPQKPYSGRLLLRVDPLLHARAAMLAEAQGKSLNAWAQEVLARAVTATNA
jgi:predicted HicB family RNase H-like nuclease